MIKLKERIISLLITASIALSMVPKGVVYAETEQDKAEPVQMADVNVETDWSVSVDYTNKERDEANITYRKYGVKADNANLLYLGDSSANGRESYQAAIRMLKDNGMSYIFDYGASPRGYAISYQNNVLVDSGWISNKNEAMRLLEGAQNQGYGTPDEVKALQAVQNALDSLPADRLCYPTIIFWTLGEEFGNKDEAAVEAELKKVKDKLDQIARDNGVDTALMTFQYADQPSELLKKYVSTQAFAHSNNSVPAAYAAISDFDLRHIMAERLEQAVHEHYHRINIDFDLNDVPLCERITNVSHSAVTAGAQVITNISDDGKKVNVQIERLCRQIDVSITITVKLNTNETGKAVVFNGQEIEMGVGAGTGENGMHTGIFDENVTYGKNFIIPEAEISREQGKIKFTKDGNMNILGDLPAEVRRMPETRYIIPGRGGLSYEGYDFGGWMAIDGELAGEVLHEGSIIDFPSGEVTLKPIWGVVRVEKRIEGTNTAAMLKNKAIRMERYGTGGIYTRDLLSNFTGVNYSRMTTVTILNSLPTYNTVVDANDVRRVNVPGAVYARDIGKKTTDGEAEDSIVIAWVMQRGSEYDMYIAGEGGITVEDSGFFSSESAFTEFNPFQRVNKYSLNGNLHLEGNGAARLFYGNVAPAIRTIDADTLDMSKVTNTSGMFENCGSLTMLDIGDWDVSNVTDMHNMFLRCSSLQTLDLSGWDVGNVTNMSSMFSIPHSAFGDDRLVRLDVSGWNTSKVTDMSNMFNHLNHLQTLAVEDWDVGSVTNMEGMFRDCGGLTSLDLSGWDVSKVTNMASMFNMWYGGGYNLRTLNINGWDTSEVTNMSYMFQNCRNLMPLDVGGLTVDNVTDMGGMFYNCTSLTTLDIGNWAVDNVTNMRQMFGDCTSLTTLDIGGWAVDNVTDMRQMFGNCTNLTTLDIGGWAVDNVTDMRQMFGNCTGLATLDIGGWNVSNVTDMGYMFSGCSSLQTLNLSSWQPDNLVSALRMFYDCRNLTSLDVGNLGNNGIGGSFEYLFYGVGANTNGCVLNAGTWDLKNNSTSMQYIFALSNIPNINLSGWKGINNVTDMSNMFREAKVSSLTFGGEWNTSSFDNMAKMEHMFFECSNLSTINMSGWTLPNLTNTMRMFEGCTSLNNIDLSWRGIRQTNANNFEVTGMFTGCPGGTLTITNSADSQVPLQKIADEYRNATGGNVADVFAINPISMMDEEPQDAMISPYDTATEGTATETAIEDAGTEDITTETAIEDTGTEDITTETAIEGTGTEDITTETAIEGTGTEDITTETAIEDTGTEDITTEAVIEGVTPEDAAIEDTTEGTTAAKTTLLTEIDDDDDSEPSTNKITKSVKDRPVTQAARAVTSYPTHWDNNVNLQIKEERVELNPADKADVEYTVIVKYIGDNGAASGVIELNDPISSDITIDESSIVVHYAEPVPGTVSGYVGGRVIETPHIVNENGVNYLRGRFDNMYASSQIRISFKCTISKTDDVTKKDGDYYYWDNTAYVTSLGSSDISKTNRLWWVDDKIADPDPGEEKFTLNYRYEGNVPAGVMLPVNEEYKQSDIVTLAVTPTVPRGYKFEGWYVDGAIQTGFTMPANNVTAVGRWSIDDATMPKIKFKYEYTGNVPDGAPEIGDTGAGADIPAQQEVQAGSRYIIVQINSDSGYHSFNGWTPSLSVGGVNVPGALDANGNYSFIHSGNNYVINIDGGTVNTADFSALDDVEITFTGSWTPYKGTIRFDANGGEDTVPMADMTDVEWNTAKTLTLNSFTMTDYQFVGWSMYPNGDVIKADGAVADGLITNDGDVVTLYAIWSRSEYDVRYDLSNVTSSNMASKVNYGDTYEAILSADNSLGYYLDEAVVEVSMNYGPVTQAAYDPVTGKIRIDNVTGDIFIKAYIPNESKTPEGVIEGNRNITLSEDIANNQTTLTVNLSEPNPVRGTLTYQWQKLIGDKWVDVHGETNISINLTGLTMADHGALYRCVVTYTQGVKTPATAIIGPAELTINKLEDPVGPTKPTETPTEPTKPADPTETPKEPTEPADPTETPKEPTEPADPTETPKEPTEPADPTETPTKPTEKPKTPLEPTEPNKPSNPEVFKYNGYIPRTGDISNVAFWGVCMGLSLAGVFVIFVKIRRKE